ncbi:hypothetical protein C8J56DRAFT_996947 [Mycena floridula]|nr:hypothetical protein C8J56DRAFT_996947 [Mycena floridula]
MSTAPEKEKTKHAITYPPFPTAPPGANVVPFTEFQPKGIMIETNAAGEEVDGWDIPTIALPEKHDTDRCKTNARPSFAVPDPSEQDSAPNESKGEWYEKWEIENLKNPKSGGYDPQSNPIARLYTVSGDFKKRVWPSEPATGVRALYDQFMLYVGVLATTPVWRRTDKKDETANGDESDNEDENVEVNVGEKEKKPDLVDNEPVPVNNSKEEEALLEAERDRKEMKMLEFIDDPATHVQVFLSAYMRDQGLIWSDKHLVNAPRLLTLFVKYTLRHRVFPEPKFTRGFEKALTVIEDAAKCLPLTSKLAKALPDSLNLSLQETFDTLDKDFKAEECFKASLESSDVEFISAQDLVASEDERIIDSSEVPTWGAETTWDDDAADPWSAPAPDNDWSYRPPNVLMNFMGLTPLPLTHCPGVREWSIRKIKEVIPPPKVANKPALLEAGAYPEPEAVEADLESRFTKIVLTPWIKWDGGKSDDVPLILPLSNGPVVVEGESRIEQVVEGSKSIVGRKPHDPYNDDITIFVEDSVVETLVPAIGMGLGGTWVQLARNDEDFGGEKRSRKKKSKLTRSGERFWYMHDMPTSITSYHRQL